jgi:hypothetical protein
MSKSGKNPVRAGIKKESKMDKEFLQYIEYTGYNDLLNFDEENVARYKKTFNYQMWRLKKALEEFIEAVLNLFKRG